MTIKNQKEILISKLSKVSDSPAFEANELLAFATGCDKATLALKQREELSKAQQKRLNTCLKKRIKGLPLQYIIGEWEFYSLPFKVGKGVLIPRVDSELLVDLALKAISSNTKSTLFDLCSGSGALGIAVAKNAPNVSVTLVEKSPKAFKYLRQNVMLNAANLTAVRADIFKWKPECLADIVICNPPYITKKEMRSLQKEVKNEPTAALCGGEDGLKFYRFIINNANRFLKPNGKMLFEIGYTQANDVAELFKAANFKQIEVEKDLSGNDRVVSAVFKM